MIKINNKNLNKLIYISTMKEIVGIKTNYKKKLEDLLFIDDQKDSLIKNTINFISNKNFSNVLLWGEKGMGKSSLVHAVIDDLINKDYKNLNFLEVLSHDIKYLPEIIYKLSSINKKFIVFIDDLIFKPFSNDFNILKSVLEGSLLSSNKNITYYFTTNMRNISLSSNQTDLNDLETKDIQNSIFSLSERFGICLGFYRCSKDEYLQIINNYSKSFQIKEDIKADALSWSILKGGYSGRIAFQFFIDYFNRK